MTTRGRALRFTAVSALVVLSLTGFTAGRGHGHGHGSDDGGGGCSSSSQDHDSSSSSSDGDVYKDDGSSGSGTSGGYGDGRSHYDDDDDDDGGSGDSSGALQAATVELVSCATADDPYATVEVTNPNDVEYTFAVTVFFKDGGDVTLDDARQETTVPAGSTSRVRLAFDAPGEVADHCELDDDELLPLT
ncbi:hypothetical protein [Streptomyces sp. JHA26]|uniref:hypothetical protein n=1 Tax=Streptomyces sp. JHA26 TaxID=1917143 RepID=UPI00098AFADF|nr:hypothetical protein [Streptomyces sp. JHA26]